MDFNFIHQCALPKRTPSKTSVVSTTSTDSGYESLTCVPVPLKREYSRTPPASPNRDYILGLADPEYRAPSSNKARRVQQSPTFQCTICPRRFTRAYGLRTHLKTHTDERPFVCTICGKAFARQHDRKRHEGVHTGEKKFVCKGELRQNGQWGCERRFARADALGRHFRSDAGSMCIQPLLAEEADELRRRSQETARPEHNIPTQQNLVSTVSVDESGNYTLPAVLLAQYPALAALNWAEFSTEDDGYDGDLSGRSSFDASGTDYCDEMDGGNIVNQPIIKEEMSEESTETNPTKEQELDTNTVLVSGCASKIAEESEPRNFTTNADSAEVKEESQVVLDSKAPISSSAVSADDEIDYQSKTRRDSADPCIDILTHVSKQADGPEREVDPINSSRRIDSPLQDEVSSDYEYLSDASTSESDFEDNESSETETTSSEASSESSLIAPILESYIKEAVDSLMTEFKSLLDHSLGIRSRTASTGSSNSSSPPPSSLEEISQQGAHGNGKRKKRDMDGFRSSRDDEDDGDDDQCKRRRLEGPSQSLSPRKFACPYYRRNPEKHKKHRSCAGPGWISIHRVKEHVFRQHCLPVHCHRCCKIFKTDPDLVAHQRLPQGCEVKVGELLEGCSKEQEKLLRKRKRGLGSEEDKWKDIFKSLFPDSDEDMIPTPYYDDEQIATWESRRDDEFAQYEQYLAQELPRVVRRQLEQAVSESARPFESQLRSQLVDIVRDAQSALFRSYRQRQSSSALPEENESEISQVQTDVFNDQEPPPIFDFSAFFAPPPVAETYSNPAGVDISTSLLGDPAESYQPTSDSGYGSNSVSFDGSGRRFGQFDSGARAEFPDLFNDEAAPPPNSHVSHQSMDPWYQ